MGGNMSSERVNRDGPKKARASDEDVNLNMHAAELSPSLSAFADELGRLTPSTDWRAYGRMMYAAGQAAARQETAPRSGFAWPAAFFAASALAASLALILFFSPRDYDRNVAAAHSAENKSVGQVSSPSHTTRPNPPAQAI